MTRRCHELTRKTRETEIRLRLDLDGSDQVRVGTGLGFLDHMLTSLACHAGWDLDLEARGDLQVDDHHTVEDCALALGSALDAILGDRRGLARFGSTHVPLDEALARAVIDLSGRPWAEIHLALKREKIGQVSCENLDHFFRSLAMAARIALHVDVLRGSNDHHRAEAAFKATAVAFRQALARRETDHVASTKGSLG